MKVSIIMPAYNATRYLSETLDSVLAQTHREWELVVVDDGSTDETPDVVRAYGQRDPRIRLVQQANARTAAARNRGFAEADPRSEFIAYLDSDDLWETYMLETLLDGLKAHPHLGASHGLVRYIDGQGRPLTSDDTKQQSGEERYEIRDGRLVRLPLDAPTTFATLLIGSFITPGQVLIRRSLVEAVGNWDSTFLIVDDYNLWLRMAQLTDFAFVNRVVIAYRLHGANWSRRMEPLWKEFVFLMRKTLASPGLKDVHRSAIINSSVFHFTRIIAERAHAEEGEIPFNIAMMNSGPFAKELAEIASSRENSDEVRRVALNGIYVILNELSNLAAADDISDQHRHLALSHITMIQQFLSG